MNNRISLQAYDENCLEKSWVWLNDPEIRKMTMTPVFTREDQLSFYEQLPHRKDYYIWSISLNESKVIGAAGLKNHRGMLAEYWGYIGEKRYWNRGFGRQTIEIVEQKARDFGFVSLDLKVSVCNLRAIALYEKVGFSADPSQSTKEYLYMLKEHI